MPVTRPHNGGAVLPGSRYDAVLAAIPLMLVLGTLGGHAVGASLRESVAVGSLLASLLVAYALFGAPPGTGRGGERISG
ncbi:MAG: hypothetical protein ABEJ68_10490 [Halobacteriaceae archaeon]